MTDAWIGIGIKNETAEGERGVRQSLSNIEGAAKSAKTATEELGTVLRRGLGAIGGYLAVREVLKNTIEAERSVAKLQAQIRATGGAAGQSVEGLKAMAEQLQKTTTFSDDTVMSAPALMLTFNKVGGETFPRAIRAATDMAAALGQDLGSAAFVVGKALQNPAEGLSMLGRQIGGIDNETEKYIKRLVETGRLQQAQAKVLELLESRYKGNAEAMRNTLGGAIEGLKNSFGDLLEGKGGNVNDMTKSINELTKTLSDPDVVNAFQQFVGGVLKAVGWLVQAGTKAVEIVRALGEGAAKLVTSVTDPGLKMYMDKQEGKGELLPGKIKVGDKEGLKAWAQTPEAQKLFANAPKLTIKGMGGGKEEPPGPLSGDALKEAERAKAAYDQLRASMFGVADGVNAYAKAMEVAEAAGAKPQDVLALSDAFAENLVGGLDSAAQATRDYETQMGVLQELLGRFEDTGGKEGISPERFAELSGRATEAWRAVVDGSEEAGEAVQTNLIDKFDELQNLLVDLSSEWGKSAAQVVNGLGRVVTAQDKLKTGKAELKKLEDSGKKGSAEWLKTQEALRAATLSQIGGYGTMAEGAASFFNEGSKGYKALTTMSQVFHAVELAGTLAELAPKAISAVLTQGQGDPYTAFARMAAMAALVAGLGVAVGGGGGGGGRPRPSNNMGTGTVLGDPLAASKSITNSLEQMESLADSQLDVSYAMLTRLRSIDASIRGVSTALVRNFALSGNATPFANVNSESILGGGKLGEFNKAATDVFTLGIAHMGIPGLSDIAGAVNSFMGGLTNQIARGIHHSTKKVTASGIAFDGDQTIGEIMAGGIDAQYYQTIKKTSRTLGIKTSSSTKTKYADIDDAVLNQLTSVVTDLGEGVLMAVGMLGEDVDAASELLAAMELDIGKVDLKGLTGEEIQERLAAVFSSLGDRMAEEVTPELARFQQVGEGMFETLVRVASETKAVTGLLGALGFEMGDLAVMVKVELTQAIIDMSGGVDKLASGLNDFLEGFYTDGERLRMQGDRLRGAFADLGVAMPSSASQFRALVEGLDLTTTAGQEMFSTLIAMAGDAAEYYNALNEAHSALQDALKEARGQGLLPEQQLQDLLDQFNSSYAVALTSTGEELVTSADTITSLIGPLLEQITEVYATGSQAQGLRDFVLSAGDVVAALLQGPAAPSAPVADAQLAEANEHLAAQVRVSQEGFTQLIDRADRILEGMQEIVSTTRLSSLEP